MGYFLGFLFFAFFIWSIVETPVCNYLDERHFKKTGKRRPRGQGF